MSEEQVPVRSLIGSVLMSGLAMLALWMFMKRRQAYPKARPSSWHRCALLHCESGATLIRPAELLCARCSVRLPQLLRRDLERATPATWPALARRCIDFVTWRNRDLGEVFFGENVPYELRDPELRGDDLEEVLDEP